RAAWAWRTYLTAARAAPERTIELRYEELVARPEGEADRGAASLGSLPAALRGAFGEVHASSVGRWRRDLTAEQVADVEAEAGALLAELGYEGRRYPEPVDERYPIGETDSVVVAVLRHERAEAGYTMSSTAITTRGRDATLHLSGQHCG